MSFNKRGRPVHSPTEERLRQQYEEMMARQASLLEPVVFNYQQTIQELAREYTPVINIKYVEGIDSFWSIKKKRSKLPKW